MIMTNVCDTSRMYFYDLCCDNPNNVPESVITHISKCKICQNELATLKNAIEQRLSNSEHTHLLAISNTLRLHFSCINLPITCSVVKPFIPSIADPLLELSKPTPITAHIENCSKCAGDIKNIRAMELSHTQLCRLGRLLAESFTENSEECRTMYRVLGKLGACNFDSVDESTLKHISLCSACSERLLKLRQAALDHISNEEPSRICDMITTTDFFDYVVPYGINSKASNYVNPLKLFGSHITSCPKCIEKVQQIHRTITGIKQRVDSGVVTLMSFENSENSKIGAEQFVGATKVEVLAAERSQNRASKHHDANKLSTTNTKFARYLKPVAAAAVLAVAISLLFIMSNSRAMATDLASVYDAICKIKNVHIRQFQTDANDPGQEKWISRRLNKIISRTNNYIRRIDLNTGLVSTICDNSEAQVTSLTGDDINNIRASVVGSLNLMPFSTLRQVPQDAKWERVESAATNNQTEIQIYDLNWTKQGSSGQNQYKKWRFHIDKGVPSRIECYEKRDIKSDYTLCATLYVDYPKDIEISNVDSLFEK